MGGSESRGSSPRAPAGDRGVRGRSAYERRTIRRTRTRPLAEALHDWLDEQLRRLPGRSPLAMAMHCGVSHRDGLGRFLDDGRIEIDTNVVERAMPCSRGATRAAPNGRPSPR